MRHRVRAALASAAVVVALAGCGSGSETAADGTISQAPKAPKSDFAVACPEFIEPQTDPDDGKLPAVSLECLGSEGDPITMSGKPPRPTVINLWAAWCGPCREEMPVLEQFAEAAAGQVDLLGIATSDTRSAATAFAVEFGLTFPTVLDPKAQVHRSLGFQGLPATVFMDADGVIVYKHIGVYDSVDEIKQDVADHLEVTL